MEKQLEVGYDTVRLRLFQARLKARHPEKADEFMALPEAERRLTSERQWRALFPIPKEKALEHLAKQVSDLAAKPGSAPHVERMFPLVRGKSHNTMEYLALIEELRPDLSPESLSRLQLPLYLMVVEGVFTGQVNLLCVLAAGKGYRPSGSATDRGDLFDTVCSDALYNKLGFLDSIGLERFTDACDRDLRNCIAHLDYVVFTNGAVGYQGRRGTLLLEQRELEEKCEALRSTVDIVNEGIRDGLAKVRR
jgi:hypothetical protein